MIELTEDKVNEFLVQVTVLVQLLDNPDDECFNWPLFISKHLMHTI